MKFTLPFLITFLYMGIAFSADHEGFRYVRGKLSGQAVIYNHGVKLRLEGDAAEAAYYQLEGVPEKDKGCASGMTKRQSELPFGLQCTKLAHVGENGKNDFECLMNINLATARIENSNALCEKEGRKYKWVDIEGRGTVSQDQLAEFQIKGLVAGLMYDRLAGKIEKDTGCSSGITKRLPGLICTKSVWRSKNEWNTTFECFVNINLKTGRIENDPSGGMCPDED